jgi:putative thioredoxin
VEWIKDITDEEFRAEVIDRSRDVPVVVDFWAEWCGPCRILGPTLEKLAREYQGKFILAKLDVDRNPRHAQAFGVRGIPTVIAFRKGQIASEFSGALPEASVRQFIDSICPSEADELFEAAESESPDKAAEREAFYRRALGIDVNHQGAMLGLAEILVARGDTGEAEPLVAKLVPGGPFAERIEKVASKLKLSEWTASESEKELRTRIAANEDPGPSRLELGKLLASEKRYPEALEVLFEAAQSSPELAQGEAKELMVEIFHVIGVRSPLADDYRAKLARLLY